MFQVCELELLKLQRLSWLTVWIFYLQYQSFMNCSWNCLLKIVLLNSMWILFLSHSFRLKLICWQCPFVSGSRISVDNHRMVLFEWKYVVFCNLYLFLFQSWPHIRLLPHVLWLHSIVGRPCCFSDCPMAYQWSVFLWVRLRLTAGLFCKFS